MPSERDRLAEPGPWRRIGPYLAERQWGTVREDRSADGSAWESFSHDEARSRAYRWGEDGLAGVCDERQRLCFALALWNERDPILKERAFGLTNREGNHGEDVKEYYYFLDSTPTHSWMRWLYKYPQAEYPYEELVAENARRGAHDFEYELCDTGVFDEDRYFDVEVDYAKAGPDDILITIAATNVGPDAAPLHLLPTLWFRKTWEEDDPERPGLSASAEDPNAIRAYHPVLGVSHLHVDSDCTLLFTENETNSERFGEGPNRTPYVKDAFHELLVAGNAAAVNPDGIGTKAALHLRRDVAPGETWTVRLRFSPESGRSPFADFEQVRASRRAEADEFYETVMPSTLTDDQRLVMRQALAGMLWSKQYYFYDVAAWLRARGRGPFTSEGVRNGAWYHMENAHVFSMPDTWEYPWYATWDLAFHCVALAIVDPQFAKDQLELVLGEAYMHPNGQVPAYEWDFSDVNPPVHAWSALYVYRVDAALTGRPDQDFLQRVFQKLLLNFTWWVNRKDPRGHNVFQGGFLGLDNIGVFDRSRPLPTGGQLEQADGTAWMALFSQCMLAIALELTKRDRDFADLAFRFAEHFLWIRAALDRMGPAGMWDDDDGFFYDVMRLPDGSSTRLKVRSMVGLLPLAAATVFDAELGERFPEILERLAALVERHPELNITVEESRGGYSGRRLLSVLNTDQLRRVLSYVLDENEFLSLYGLRSISRVHLEHPYSCWVDGTEYRVDYEPAESTTRMFGGNSNWRGPIWFPVNVLIIRALVHLYGFYGDDFRVECPTGSGRELTLFEVALELSNRLVSIFSRDDRGRRPVFGGNARFQQDPRWRDHILFHEYFHGDNGAGLGASHQTGWTGVVALLIQVSHQVSAAEVLERGVEGLVSEREG